MRYEEEHVEVREELHQRLAVHDKVTGTCFVFLYAMGHILDCWGDLKLAHT